tara:strand:+ start:49 stop:588 length:540 start_codon:yes stop_codon:yes gene_type:complete
MSIEITADNLLKAMLPSVTKGQNIVIRANNVLEGRHVSDKVLDTLQTLMTNGMGDMLPESESKATTIKTSVNRVLKCLAVSEQLGLIVQTATEVHADDEERAGNTYIAMMRGVNLAFTGKGGNEIVSGINETALVKDAATLRKENIKKSRAAIALAVKSAKLAGIDIMQMGEAIEKELV